MQLNEKVDILRDVLDYGERSKALEPRMVEGVRQMLESLRAQADARPVAWLSLCTKGPKVGQVEVAEPNEKSSNPEYWTDAFQVYTHPEASAPGLSSQEILAAARAYVQPYGWLKFPSGAEFVELVQSLTRASAATVAEPSKTATHGDENMPKRGTLAWLIRLLQQLQVAGTASEAKVYINDPTFGRVEVGGALYGIADVELTPNDDDEEAAQQQAEPGADERAEAKLEDLPDWVRNGKCPPTDAELAVMRSEFEGFFKARGCSDAEFVPHSGGRISYGRAMTQAAWEAWQLRAAQSGQRAGVAESNETFRALIAFVLRNGIDGIEFLRCWNEGDFAACRKEWPEAPDACYIGADPMLAAPTQQQEGGDV